MQRLEQAADANRRALEVYTREHRPLEWAAVQGNLGIVLQRLGERESGTKRLELAVVAARTAVEVFTREHSPGQWAAGQQNLGNALWTLAERESGTERLMQAMQAYRLALEVFTREGAPQAWATTHNNIGAALMLLGERENRSDRLEEAIEAYRNLSAGCSSSVSDSSSGDGRSGRNSASSSSALFPNFSHVCSNARRSSAAVHVRTAFAAYSSIWPTTCRRTSGFAPRFTSTNVGIASWSTSRWSTNQREPAFESPAIPFSRVTRSHRRDLPIGRFLLAEQFKIIGDQVLQIVLLIESLLVQRFHVLFPAVADVNASLVHAKAPFMRMFASMSTCARSHAQRLPSGSGRRCRVACRVPAACNLGAPYSNRAECSSRWSERRI